MPKEPKAEEAPKPEAEVKPTEKAVEPPAPPVEKPAAPQQDMTEKERAFLRAMQEERQKRQELERRLQAIEAGKQPAGQQEQPKTFWDDPEGALAKHQADMRRETMNAKLQLAETIARRTHADFDQKVEVFGQLIAQTPGLREQWIASSDPAEFAYTVAKNHMELQEVGSIDALREKVAKETEARVRAQIEAEMKAKAEALARERAALPPSLSEARSSGQQNRPVWNGPTPFDDIIKG